MSWATLSGAGCLWCSSGSDPAYYCTQVVNKASSRRRLSAATVHDNWCCYTRPWPSRFLGDEAPHSSLAASAYFGTPPRNAGVLKVQSTPVQYCSRLTPSVPKPHAHAGGHWLPQSCSPCLVATIHHVTDNTLIGLVDSSSASTRRRRKVLGYIREHAYCLQVSAADSLAQCAIDPKKKEKKKGRAVASALVAA